MKKQIAEIRLHVIFYTVHASVILLDEAVCMY